MFTVRDIRDIAIQIETNGEATYRRTSRQVSDPDMAEVLVWMADEEARHAQWFAHQFSQLDLPSDIDSLELISRALLRDSLDEATFSLDADMQLADEDLIGLFEQAIAFEDDTILFYEMLSGFASDEQTAQHLAMIVAEEQQHVVKLQQMADNSRHLLETT